MEEAAETELVREPFRFLSALVSATGELLQRLPEIGRGSVVRRTGCTRKDACSNLFLDVSLGLTVSFRPALTAS